MSPRPHMTADEVDRAVQMHAEGQMLAHICQELDRAPATIRRHLAPLGIIFPRRGRRSLPAPISDITAAVAALDYQDGATIQQLAQRLGIGYRRCTQLLQEQGVELRPAGRRRKPRRYCPVLTGAGYMSLAEAQAEAARRQELTGAVYQVCELVEVPRG
jgi:hypothetical protein